ncbi:molybdenum cofactor guanylyltransferase [Rhodanobacter sp. FW510-R12]|uniref:molybdenum cofactor guanylyltransferase n=1 Tax=unclassified Rhodanobacter TaxID=2621553 RepID=UPI0007A9A608|nr:MULTISPECIES: molybdenum cofactor guanylyltransferase [unclassified Rhodanobacter]KZC28337.1 molybdenum cofactor guanylyltransferase [Rhodanobacter sp. FW510-T8]KZC32712.1 molybdenum cofactor guanylyltransferase [Rhodanobacter sp. FW510-R10]
MLATRTAEPSSVLHGVVLAGGRSSRMGTDKAGLSWHGQPLLEHMRERLRQAGAARVLVSGPYPGIDGMPDQQTDLGPLGGLLTLAQTQPDGVYLLVAVDMPLLTASLLRRLAAAVTAGDGAPCAIWAGHMLPLCLRLDVGVRAVITDLASRPRRARSLRALHGALGGAELILAEADERHLVNCNTPEEWRGVAA